MKKTTLVAALLLMSSVSYAGDCVITIERKACAGKETEAFKPYNGKNPTEETKKLDSAEACTKWAEKSSKIVRKGTLTEKKVTGKFDGADLGKTFADKAECK
ncbi:hypothetical protein AZI85_12070 [Bdellovibrio bacteriovorus]|uniref:Uncharacterized protein n=1 Tax=Bdellovibrio bacteriovorus TaxID=959 RepID=A0A150WCP3_BDEBC|nr:hypothetical protein [Bdellovibrio bacteriovorus]KYG60723.1 hypothetical protein AZI85_12070 [Bdellovibrio bacteriovorus]